MFCKASVLKCPGLKKKKKRQLNCFACRVIPFSYNENLQVHFVSPHCRRGKKKKNKENGSMLAKTGAKCTKTLIS